MAAQPFDRLLAGDRPLLREVESVVVDAHRRWYATQGRADWSEPKAYRWLRYEDPEPVARLADGVRRLPAGYDEAAVGELERLASGLGRRLAS
jgi:hypothetical protein